MAWIADNAPRLRRDGSFLSDIEFNERIRDNVNYGVWRGTDVNGREFATRDGCIQFQSQQAKMNGGAVSHINKYNASKVVEPWFKVLILWIKSNCRRPGRAECQQLVMLVVLVILGRCG